MPYSATQCLDLMERQLARIKVDFDQHVLSITLNRPSKRNAFDPWMVNELAYALCFAKHNPAVRLVQISAEGPVFCAGADLKAFAGMLEDNPGTDIPEPEQTVVLGDLFRTLYKPCIAKVKGDVYAGGFLITCGCTHVLAADSAKFGLPEVKRGIWPMQVMASLQTVVPGRKLLDWCMRGSVLSAAEAHKLGVVTHIQTIEEIDTHADELSKEILQGSPVAIRNGLQAFDQMQGKSHEELHTYLQGMLVKTLNSEDAREGLLAFREKRPPVWPGK